MPTALRIGSYRFYFYSQDCGERQHMHVDRDAFSAKFWIEPVVSLAHNYGYSRKELRDIERLIWSNLEQLHHEWNSHCNNTADS
jgi:hypothetical protein